MSGLEGFLLGVSACALFFVLYDAVIALWRKR